MTKFIIRKYSKQGISGLYLFLITISLLTGCRKFVEVEPPVTQLVSSSVYSSDASAAAAVTSIYANMSNKGISDGSTSLSIQMGLYADELKKYASDQTWGQLYTNVPENISPGFFDSYQSIFQINSAIEGLKASETLTAPIKMQLLGEMQFMRAFLNFYLVNLYGDIPLMLSSDYIANKSISRTEATKVYGQIIQDLKDAQGNLPSDYVTGVNVATPDRIRPTRGAASALLARTYLYLGDWRNAELSSTAVISNTAIYEIVPLEMVFKKNNKEAIFQLQCGNPSPNTRNAALFIPRQGYTPTGNSTLALVSPQLKAALILNGGNRFTKWVGKYTENGTDYYYPYKYQDYLANSNSTEYMTILRLAEQYLIRAEARVHLGDLPGAKSDILVLRNRAGLPGITTDDPDLFLKAISDERQVELFSEWGDRWFDLKRRGKVSEVMEIVAPLKGGTWSEYKKLFPIPQSEIDLNPNLKPNNPGYSY